jgi:putative SOS response-associated peptidase YedK
LNEAFGFARDGTKQPYYIQPAGDGEVFSIAALWDRSRTESGQDKLSCAIITMPASELLTEIHNAKQHMPLIFPPESVDAWLTGTPERATALLVPCPSELMHAHQVSKRVNAPRHDDPELMAPVELETEQQALQLN